MSDWDDPDGFGAAEFDTRAVRVGTHRTGFNEHSDAIFPTSSFVFENAAQAAALFTGGAPGYFYSRAGNPTVRAFEQRLASLEGGEDAYASASGMSSILTLFMATVSAGEHIVASRSLFGATIQLLTTILPRFGISVSFVETTDLTAVDQAIQNHTRLIYIETPSNPLTEVADVEGIAKIAKAHGVLFAVDNCFCTPALQNPLALGADIVVHSATKYLEGQGRVLGGAIVGTKAFIQEKVAPLARTLGPALSPFNAWVIHKGLETLGIRMRAQSETAMLLAQWLSNHPAVARVLYPGLPSHPQHDLAMKQQSAGGAVLSFEVLASPETARATAWRVVDACKAISITANLGDVRSTITHPASTTHGRISPDARQAAGVSEGLLRIAVGLESLRDLQADLDRGLAKPF